MSRWWLAASCEAEGPDPEAKGPDPEAKGAGPDISCRQ
jgi:hypothetical protein